MKFFALVGLLALACVHVYGKEHICPIAISHCQNVRSYIVSGITNRECEEKAILFGCFRDFGCDRDDASYTSIVTSLNYETCGASGLMVYWTLTACMVAIVKYFSK